MDRNWIVLALALLLTATVGCKKDDPVVEPPPVDTTPTAPTQDVDPMPKPASADMTEKKPPESIQQIEERLRSQGLIGDVFFDFNEYDLRSEARERLAKNAEFMLSPEGRDYIFTIEGHCDERGTNEYNLALGENRGSASADYLASLGVTRDRFQVISYGEERPFCTESNEACWQKNRRARFVIKGSR